MTEFEDIKYIKTFSWFMKDKLYDPVEGRKLFHGSLQLTCVFYFF